MRGSTECLWKNFQLIWVSDTTNFSDGTIAAYFPTDHCRPLILFYDCWQGYSSRLAALDYTVCLFSEVFVTTHGGNFPHFLMGHRRFLFDGHSKTINPDKRKLVLLFQDMNISWVTFKDQMEIMLSENDRKGIMVPRVRKINRKTSIYTYPLPECRCLQQSHNTTLQLTQPAR